MINHIKAMLIISASSAAQLGHMFSPEDPAMPFIRISVFGRNAGAAEIQRLQTETTRLMTSIMRKPAAGTAVLVEQVCGDWSIAGRSVVVGAQVDVTIGRGTNTAEEKARFISEMMALLRAALGDDLPEASYIVLHELDLNSYGRGGITRAERERRAETSLVGAGT